MEKIVVVDFGSQYTQLIARRIREIGVFSEIVPWFDLKFDASVKGVVLSGGPASVREGEAPKIRLDSLPNVPVLGICYGHQLLATLLGGKVGRGKGEFGKTVLKDVKDSTLLREFVPGDVVWMSHWDEVKKLPKDVKVIASTDGCRVAAFERHPFYGVQFHPEVYHTPKGKAVFETFAFDICKIKEKWKMEDFVEKTIEELRRQVKGKVLCAASGGVDSTTLAFLLHKAVGRNLVAVFVNNGLLRKGEVEEVRGAFKEHKIPLHYIDASETFLQRLKGVTDPERKRKIIGNTFIEIFEDFARKTGVQYLAQGTLYPDVIESGGFPGAARIKSHHNVGGLPERLSLKLIEPFKLLFKDEVRKVAKIIGVPEHIIRRHPFPGPGLAVRILGEITPENLKVLREADRIVIEEIKRAGIYDEIWQAFAVLLPVKSVGVQGDTRSYGRTVVVRAVTSVDGMTAHWYHMPYEVLEKISERITREIEEVNRVVYDVTSKPPATIEWE